MSIQLTTKSSALNVFTADGLSYGRIAPSASVSTDLDFKFKDGAGFVSLHKVAHYHSGTRYVLGDQLAAMVTATAAEATRATAAEQKISSDLSAEAKRATDAEAKVAADLATEVQRANAAEGTIIAAITSESTERKNADTVAATALSLEISQRTAADASISQDLATAVQDLAQEDSNLSTRIDGQEVATSNLNNSLTSRIDGLDQSFSSAIGSFNSTIGDIMLNQLPGLSYAIATETARAQQVEGELEQQITSLLSNTDATALNSLAELVADYSQNGSTVTGALNSALARILQLEQTVAALQNQSN